MRPPLVAVAGVVLLAACADDTGGLGPLVPHTLTYDFSGCPLADRPLWFAHQDGQGGAWVVDTAVDARYTFTISRPVGATARVVSTYGLTALTVSWFLDAEMPSGTRTMCGNRDTVVVNTSLAGLPYGHFGELWFGNWGVMTTGDGQFQFWGIRPGVYDLLANHYNAFTGGEAAMVFRRDVAVWTDTTLPVVDFAVDSAFAPAKAKLTVTGLGADTLQVSTYYHTGIGCARLGLPPSWPGDSMVGMPAARQRPGDYHELQLVAAYGDTRRQVVEWFHSLADRTVAFGPELPAPAVTRQPGSYRRLSARITLPPEYRGGADFFYAHYQPNAQTVDLEATSGYIDETATATGGAVALTLTTPDFAALAGWQPGWGPPAAAEGPWQLNATGPVSSWCAENGRTVSAWARGLY